MAPPSQRERSTEGARNRTKTTLIGAMGTGMRHVSSLAREGELVEAALLLSVTERRPGRLVLSVSWYTRMGLPEPDVPPEVVW
jgi:hypothetical protein